ncbi:MAG: hypothetical protein QOJ80_6952 [Mycobacterium sp.]|jgi:hypothetical protein|nr:hypothetical protein [Mycobacterium sp.]
MLKLHGLGKNKCTTNNESQWIVHDGSIMAIYYIARSRYYKPSTMRRYKSSIIASKVREYRACDLRLSLGVAMAY